MPCGAARIKSRAPTIRWRLLCGDWGPQAVPTGVFQVLDGESCGSGVIVDIDAGKAGDKRLWVERKDGSLSFPPPGMERCPQGNRIYDFFRDLRYRMHGRTFQ